MSELKSYWLCDALGHEEELKCRKIIEAEYPNERIDCKVDEDDWRPQAEKWRSLSIRTNSIRQVKRMRALLDE